MRARSCLRPAGFALAGAILGFSGIGNRPGRQDRADHGGPARRAALERGDIRFGGEAEEGGQGGLLLPVLQGVRSDFGGADRAAAPGRRPQGHGDAQLRAERRRPQARRRVQGDPDVGQQLRPAGPAQPDHRDGELSPDRLFQLLAAGEIVEVRQDRLRRRHADPLCNRAPARLRARRQGGARAMPRCWRPTATASSTSRRRGSRRRAWSTAARTRCSPPRPPRTRSAASSSASRRRFPCAGWASDARRYSPNYAAASAVVDWTVMLKEFVSQARSGKLSATTFNATFQNGGPDARNRSRALRPRSCRRTCMPGISRWWPTSSRGRSSCRRARPTPAARDRTALTTPRSRRVA